MAYTARFVGGTSDEEIRDYPGNVLDAKVFIQKPCYIDGTFYIERYKADPLDTSFGEGYIVYKFQSRIKD